MMLNASEPPREERRGGRRRALVGHVHDVDCGHALELLGGEVLRVPLPFERR